MKIFIHSFINHSRLFILSYVSSFIYSSICSIIHLSILRCIHLFIHCLHIHKMPTKCPQNYEDQNQTWHLLHKHHLMTLVSCQVSREEWHLMKQHPQEGHLMRHFPTIQKKWCFHMKWLSKRVPGFKLRPSWSWWQPTAVSGVLFSQLNGCRRQR